MWYNTLILHHSASRGWGGMTLYFMNHVLILLKSWNSIKLHNVNWDTTIFFVIINYLYISNIATQLQQAQIQTSSVESGICC